MRRNSSNTSKETASKIILTVLFTIFVVLWIFPLVWVFNGALKSADEWATNPNSFFPSMGYTFENFKTLFVGADQTTAYNYSIDKQPVAQWVLNSLIVSVSHTALYLVISSLAAYAFTFLEFKGRDTLFYILIATMTIPGIVLTTPQFVNIVKMGLSLNLLSIILPGLGGIGGIFLMRQFFKGIPKSLVESASIDGASKSRTFLTVVLPLAKPVLFVQGMFSFMGVWNDFQWAQIVLGYGSKETWTLQLGLTYLVDLNRGTQGAQGVALAASVISMIPMLLIYIVASNHIIEGVAMTGVKE